VRNRSLHDALRNFALEAAALLTDEVAAGAILSFDVVEERGRGGAVLYNYRPLTADFVGERWRRLSALPSFAPAARALGSGAAAYLRLRGERGADAEPALRALLERLYEDAAGFEFPEERFERVYAEVERVLYEHAMRATIVAPLRGLGLAPERVELGGGLSLVRGDVADAPPEAAWPADGGEPYALCVLECDVDAGAPLPLDDARERFLALQTALRLYQPGGLAAGPLGWARADDGAWTPFAVAGVREPRGAEWLLELEDVEDLQAFLGALGGAAHGGAVAWALARFEMGCERDRDVDGLTDHLLALGALLDAHDDVGRASLSLRVAALCAPDGERRAVQRRVERAIALERLTVTSGGVADARGPAYLEAIGPEPAHELAAEVEGHVRAVLRDVLCGHLDADLPALADDILLSAGDPHEIEARDPWPPRTVEPEHEGEIEIRRGAPREPVTDELPGMVDNERDARARADAGELERVTAELPALDTDPGVTPSADWDVDEDAASYSAPV
jgi:hypothetical protein